MLSVAPGVAEGPWVVSMCHNYPGEKEKASEWLRAQAWTTKQKIYRSTATKYIGYC